MSNNFDMEEINRIREERHAELKNRIKLAKENSMHESFIRFLEAYEALEIENKNPMIFHKGATEEQIAEFEKEFNVKIPECYCEILKFSNGFDAFEACVDFYGVSKKPPLGYASDVYYSMYTENANKDGDAASNPIPENLLIIGKTLSSNLICVNLNTYEIVGWDYRDMGEEEYFLNTNLHTYFEEDLVDSMNDREVDNG